MSRLKELPELITKSVDKECRLQEQYLEILKRERDAIVRGDAELINHLAEGRGALSQQILDISSARRKLLEDIPGYQGERLSEIVQQKFGRAALITLAPKITRLKGLIEENKRESRELNGVVGFAMNIVNGALAIISSARNSITRGYNASGQKEERYSPTTSRSAGVLERA